MHQQISQWKIARIQLVNFISEVWKAAVSIIIIIIIIIIIRHELSLDRPVWSSSLLEGLPRRLRPFGLQFSSTFGIKLLLIFAICRTQFQSHLLSFSITGSSRPFSSSKMIHSFCGQKECTRLLLWKNFNLIDVNRFYPLLYGSKFRFHIEEWEAPVHYILYSWKFRDQSWFRSVV